MWQLKESTQVECKNTYHFFSEKVECFVPKSFRQFGANTNNMTFTQLHFSAKQESSTETNSQSTRNFLWNHNTGFYVEIVFTPPFSPFYHSERLGDNKMLSELKDAPGITFHSSGWEKPSFIMAPPLTPCNLSAPAMGYLLWHFISLYNFSRIVLSGIWKDCAFEHVVRGWGGGGGSYWLVSHVPNWRRVISSGAISLSPIAMYRVWIGKCDGFDVG